jgi:hypothetical protein
MAKVSPKSSRPTAPGKTKKPVSAARKAAPKTSSRRTRAPADAAPLVDRLAAATGLDRETLLERALRAFAAAHGLDAPAAQPVREAPAPIPVVIAAPPRPAPAANPAPVASEAPALAANVRLYVHGLGRPPQEMIRDTYVIGSSKKCDLWVNGPKIETNHLRIDRVGDKYFMTDLNTAGGTRMGSEQLVGQREIKHEDSVYLANYHRVRFYLVGGPE